jgi:anthranilate synthase/phosphoribosyltransferase
LLLLGGVKVLKHGSPGNTDNVGSSDFLKYNGVNLFAAKELVERATEQLGFAYTEALDQKYKHIHVQTHEVAGLAHMNDIIGPVTHPANPRLLKKKIIGINHLVTPERVAQAYRIMNQKGITNLERGLFVRGFAETGYNGGIDEVSVMPGGTLVSELNKGQIRTYHLTAKDFGLEEITKEELSPGIKKAEVSKAILANEIYGGMRSSALVNTAIIFYLTDGLDLIEGTKKADTLLSSGRPLEILLEYAKMSRGENV